MKLFNKEVSNQKVVIATATLSVLLAGGVFAWQYLEKLKGESIDWRGTYEYGEFVPPNQTWAYVLTISKTDDQFVAKLDINGFQTLTRIQSVVRPKESGGLDVIFDGYRPGNTFEVHKKGDLLFSLEKLSDSKYKILWGTLKSNLGTPPTDAAFTKVSSEVSKDETASGTMSNVPVVEQIAFEKVEKQPYDAYGVEFRFIPGETQYDVSNLEIYSKTKQKLSLNSVWRPGLFFSAPYIHTFPMGKGRFFFVEDYSGGAHCCSTVYVVYENEAAEVKLIRTLGLGNAFFGPTLRDHLLVKNGKLYLKVRDDRFAYFHASYAGSIFFDTHFVFENGELMEGNLAFKNEYLATAARYEKELEDWLIEVKSFDKLQFERVGSEAWVPRLTAVVANYIMGQEENKAWKRFDYYFKRISDISPTLLNDFNDFRNPLNAASLKQEVSEIMNLARR